MISHEARTGDQSGDPRFELITVPVHEAERVAREILEAALRRKHGNDFVAAHDEELKLLGFESEAALVAACLVDAEAQGHPTHGLIRLSRYVEDINSDKVNPLGRFDIEQDQGSLLVCTGGDQFGQVAVQMAIELAKKRLQEHPTLTIALADMTHAGRLAWIVDQLTRQGYIVTSVMFDVGGAGRTSVYPDGEEPALGTNPLALGANLAFADTATTEETEGFVRKHFEAGLPLPDGVLELLDGTPTNDPALLYTDPPQAKLVPLGGRSGTAMAIAIKIMVTRLTGKIPKPGCNAMVLTVVNPHFLPDHAAPQEVAQQVLDRIKSVRTTSGKPVHIPGVAGKTRAAEAQEIGLRIPRHQWEETLRLHQELTQPKPREE